jgi:hypothetical protein
VSNTYPIVAQRNLDDVRKRKFRRRSREIGELLKPSAHEVLVYRVGDQFIVDHGARTATDEQVVMANHVSLVDMSVDAPVLIELKIPADGAAEFTVHVTFTCTVTDPAMVVRNGKLDAKVFLEFYLRGIPDLVDIGQRHRIDEINEMRRELVSWLTSFVINDPPMEHVLTPEELLEFEKRRRDQSYAHSLTRQREDQDAELQDVRQSRQHVYQDREQEHEIRSASRAQTHDISLQSERSSAQLDEMQKLVDRVGRDPHLATFLAMASGGIDAVDVARLLREEARAALARRQDEEREIRLRKLDLLQDIIKGDGDYLNIDPNKLEVFIDRLVDDVTKEVKSELVAQQPDSIEAHRRAGAEDDAE